MGYQFIIVTVCTGAGATLLTDLWNLFLKRVFRIPSLNFCFLGRWILYMPLGTFRHKSIKESPSRSMECLIGWIVHYGIGVSLTLIFILIMPADWSSNPTLLPALIYGISTVIFPLFILQPALGLGMASSKTPQPVQAVFKSLMTHFTFGAGIWLMAIVMKYLLP